MGGGTFKKSEIGCEDPQLGYMNIIKEKKRKEVLLQLRIMSLVHYHLSVHCLSRKLK